MSGGGKKGQADPRDFLPLHPLEARILLVLSHGDAHGYRIVKTIEEADGGWAKLFPANLYRRVRDLLAKGLIEEISPPEGARRRTFRITPLGRSVAYRERLRLEALAADFRVVGPPSGGGEP